jgi:hypothetical protein
MLKQTPKQKIKTGADFLVCGIPRLIHLSVMSLPLFTILREPRDQVPILQYCSHQETGFGRTHYSERNVIMEAGGLETFSCVEDRNLDTISTEIRIRLFHLLSDIFWIRSYF